MTRPIKTTGEYCAEESAKACVTTCSQECSRGCGKLAIVSIIISVKTILNSGILLSSFKEFLVESIKKYQKDISPKLNSHCLFKPSCSNYAIGAIHRYGVLRGGIRSIIRIIRCSPLTKKPLFGQVIDLP